MTVDRETERVARAMWATRECQAGMSFGVPPAARDQFVRALAVAAIAAMRPAEAEEDDGSGDWMGGPIG